jgi:hypothetical protein
MDKVKVAADLVFRYVIARALFRGTVLQLPINLEHQIRGGVRYVAGGVLLNEVTLGRTPAIVHDRKDPDFWAAVIGGDDSAIDIDAAELDEIRRVVLHDEGILQEAALMESARN